MRKLYELKEMLCHELEEISGKGEIKAGDLETVHKLTDTIKNIDKIAMLEGEGGYSQTGYSRDGYSRDGYSQGNYSRDGYSRGNSYGHYVRGHYSRDDGRERLAGEIESMMHEDDLSSQEKNALRKALEVLR